MAWESWLYGDPEKVAIRKQEIAARQARACGDCVHARSLDFQDETYHYCQFKRKQYGTRCDLYEPKK